MDLRAAGDRVDRFEIVRVLGSGGMGVVYAARDPQLDRTIALKLVKPGTTDSRERLVDEARAMAKVSHPNVISVFDAGAHHDEVWVAMECVTGGTLARWLRAEPRPWKAIVERFTTAGEGLARAHDAGLVHRDFKPENVLLADDGRVVVADFGLARFSSTPASADAARPIDAETVGDSLAAGTPSYMSPEQHVGRPADPRSDQFSFCVAFWEALFGQRPFAPGGDALQIAVAVVTGAITSPPSQRDVPTWLVRILQRGLATDPDARWPSLRALLAAIARSRRRRRMAWVGAGAVVAMAASATAAVLLVGDRSDASVACDESATPIATRWSPAHAAQVRARFAKLAAPYAAESAEHVIQALDRWAHDWRVARVETCRARAVTGEIDDAQLAGRVGCLDEHLAALDARVRLLTSEIDDKLVARALDIARLEHPALCKRDRRVDAVDDPAVRAEHDRLRQVRVDLDAEMAAGRYAKAADLAKRAGDTPPHPALPIENAQLALALAYVDANNGKYDVAISRARRAAEVLTAHGDDRGAAKSWIRALDAGIIARQLEGIDVTLAATRGAVQRAKQADLEVMLLVVEGRLAALQNRPIDAEAACREARRVLHERSVPDEPREWQIDECLVRALDGQGKLAESAALAQQNLARTESTLPKQHPRLATMLHQTGATLAKIFRMREAKQMFERALEIRRVNQGGKDFLAWELRHIAEAEYELGEAGPALAHAEESLQLALASLPPGDRELALHYSLLAKTTALAGDSAKAMRHIDEAIARIEALATPDHGAHANAIYEKAKLLAGRGRCTETLPLVDKAMKTRMQIQGVTEQHVAPYELAKAECEIALGRPRDAIARMERVLASIEGQPTGSFPLAVAFTLAHARWAAGDRTAVPGVHEIREKVPAAGDHFHLLAKIDAFLANTATVKASQR